MKAKNGTAGEQPAPQPRGKVVEIDVFAPGREQLREQMRAAATTATASAEQAQAQLQSGMQQGMRRAIGSAEALVRFQQGNIEAMGRATLIMLEGMQGLARSMSGQAQAALEDGANTVRALSEAKSIHEALSLQAGFARASVERAASGSKELTEQALKLVEDALAPLTARINAAVETTTNQMAALRR